MARLNLAMFAVLLPLVLAFPAAAQRELIPYSWETPEQTARRFLRLRQAERTLRDYYGQFRESDLAECRAQANGAFGRMEARNAVLHDCLEAKRLRRQGR